MPYYIFDENIYSIDRALKDEWMNSWMKDDWTLFIVILVYKLEECIEL